MYNEKFIGEITAVSAAVRTSKGEDGVKTPHNYLKVVLESADIDYDEMSKFNPYISATLLNIQPIPFKNIDFGEQLGSQLKMSLTDEEDPAALPKTTPKVELGDFAIWIKNLSVKVQQDIPIYKFNLEVLEGDAKVLYSILKRKITFKFWKGGE